MCLCVLATLSLSLFHNELISVQPPSWMLLPCRHSVALNHPTVYKKMRVSWEMWMLPQLLLSPCFCLTTPRPSDSSPSPVSSSRPLRPSLSPRHPFPSQPPPLPPLQEVPAVMMKVLNIRGNPRRVSAAFSHLSFCARALLLWSTVTLWSISISLFPADLLAVCFSSS